MRLQPITDQHGIEWKWNCGWTPVRRKPWEKPYYLGWDQFNRRLGFVLNESHMRSHGSLLKRVKPLERFGKRAYDQAWRRMLGISMIHSWGNGDDGYGSVTVQSTDGIHAIVTDVDGIRLEVMLDNLRPMPKPRQVRGSGTAVKREKMSPEVKQARKELRSQGIDKPNEEQMNTALAVIAERVERLQNMFK